AMRVWFLVLCRRCLLVYARPSQAQAALSPGQKQIKYSRWVYPRHVTYGPIEDGAGETGIGLARGAFLTLPFMGPHYITSVFSHCYPDYGNYTRVCRYDGTGATAGVGGPDPTCDAGGAQTAGGQGDPYYDRHDA